MDQNRIKNAIEIIKYAIEHDISIYNASVKFGYADTYVKNVKASVYSKYDDGSLDYQSFNDFDQIYGQYSQHRNNIQSKPSQSALPNKNNDSIAVKYSTPTEAEIEWKSGLNYPNNHIKTLNELLSATDVDLDVWKVKDYTINKWDVTSWKTKTPQTIQNFQIKARLEKNIEIKRHIDAAEIFKNLIENYKPPIFNVNSNNLNENSDNILEISIFDLHIGKLAWAGETGENYDVKIAGERFLSSINMLLQRAKGFNYSRILFPVGNDFFNTDNIFNTTTKGTPQDEDLRWQKTFTIGTQLLVDGINTLKQTGAIVDVIVIPGNHDFSRSYYMGSVLEAWFRNDNKVTVNNGASPRKYYRYGNVLLGFTHGDEEKENALPMIMANDIESKPLWSETKFHEWHLGHQHRKKNVKYSVLDRNQQLTEDLGVTVRYLSSLAGTEQWHHKRGFIGSVKAVDAFIWNYDLGLVAHLNSNYIN